MSDALSMEGCMSLPVRGAWIEMPTLKGCMVSSGSLPVRGAWIEI